jgi:hypothetical protein
LYPILLQRTNTHQESVWILISWLHPPSQNRYVRHWVFLKTIAADVVVALQRQLVTTSIF